MNLPLHYTSKPKPQKPLSSLVYRLYRLFKAFLPRKYLVPALLQLEWATTRACIEELVSSIPLSDNPVLIDRYNFLKPVIRSVNVVFDLGCGEGHDSWWLYQNLDKKIIGVDLDNSRIKSAQDLYANSSVHFINADLRMIPNSLLNTSPGPRLAVLCHVIEHIQDPSELLLSISQYFDFCYIEVPNYLGSNYLWQLISQTYPQYLYTDEDHYWEFTPTTICNLLTSSGWIIEHETHTYFSRIWCSNSNATI